MLLFVNSTCLHKFLEEKENTHKTENVSTEIFYLYWTEGRKVKKKNEKLNKL